MIPESFINELKYRCDIEQIIGGYVNLKKTGRNMKGLCPFHSEKTPSFVVYPENQSFYCFGCGAGGSVINFVMKIENLEYVEAVRFLADRCGMQFPENGEDDSGRRVRTRLLEMNREAARFYNELLMSDEGRSARGYLVDRGLKKSTVVHFGLGFAPDTWDTLLKYMRSKGYRDEELYAGSLASKGRNGGFYDSFRGRAMFPIIDLRGNVIAFGGRDLGERGPKYLNSGDTPVFKKSRNLFALNFAKNSKREGLILCEGYMDVISMHQAGFDNAVATLGTALTAEQARLISQYAKQVTLSYDSDEPGQKATRRAGGILDETGVTIKVLTMAGAKDPDEYIKKFGKERFELLLSGSGSVTEFELAKLQSQHDTATAEGKVEFLKGFIALVSRLPSPVERDVYISKISRELDVSRQALAAQVESTIRRAAASRRKKELAGTRAFTMEERGRDDPELQKNPRRVLAENRVLEYLIRNPDGYGMIGARLKPESFVSELNREIYSAVAEKLSRSAEADTMSLSGTLSQPAMDKFSKLVVSAGERPASQEEARESVDMMLTADSRKDIREVKAMDDGDWEKYILTQNSEKKQGVK